MASENNDKAVLPVLSSSDDHVRYVLTGIGRDIDLNDWLGHLVTLQPTIDVYVFAGRLETTGVGAETGADDADRGRLLKAGESYDFFVYPSARWLRINSTVAGSLHVYRSSR